MKLFYQLLGIAIGFVIGILTAISSLMVFGLWVYSDTKKKPRGSTYKPRSYSPGTTKERSANSLRPEFDTQAEADEMLTMLRNLVDEYGYTTFSDLKAGMGFAPVFEDDSWGWVNLKDVYALQVSHPNESTKYVLKMPEPVKLTIATLNQKEK